MPTLAGRLARPLLEDRTTAINDLLEGITLALTAAKAGQGDVAAVVPTLEHAVDHVAAETADTTARLLAEARAAGGDAVRLWELEATLQERLDNWAACSQSWRAVAELLRGRPDAPVPRLKNAYAHLRHLHAPMGLHPDGHLHGTAVRHLADLADDPKEARRLYAEVAAGWEWSRVQTEIEECRAESQRAPDTSAGLVAAWLADGALDHAARCERVLLALEGEFRALLETLTAEGQRF